MIDSDSASEAGSIATSRGHCPEWPEVLRGAVLRLPVALVDNLQREIEPLEAPWAHRYAPRIQSGAIRRVCDLVAGALATDGGIAIVAGDGLSDLPDEVLAAMHLAIAGGLGEPVGQNRAGEKLVVVHASRAAGASDVRGYRTNDGMLPHSDAADFSGLMCLSEASSGGASLFVSAHHIHDVLSAEAPELLPEYYRDWCWNVGALGFPGLDDPIRSPIFSVYRGRLSCRFGSSLLRNGAAAAGETLTEAQVAALDLFEKVALRDGVVARYKLTRGEFVWMNNQRLLHGRDAFSEAKGVDETRRLLRAWSRSAAAHQLWPRVAEFDDRLFRALED